MRATRPEAFIAFAAFAVSLLAALGASADAQSETRRPNLSGRWILNTELSENAQAKLERMHGSQEGGHGPARHGGGGSGGGPAAQMNEIRSLLLDAPMWFTVSQDADRIVLTDSDGRTRPLTANGRKEHVNGRDVRTEWDNDRLVLDASFGNVDVRETYERLTNAPQLVVTMTMNMGGQVVNVRRVYDAASQQ